MKIRGRLVIGLILAACLQGKAVFAANSCEDFKVLSRVSAEVFICEGTTHSETQDAFARVCKPFDGNELYNPTCLEQWRDHLHNKAKKFFNLAWAKVPEAERDSLWKSCKTESSRFDLVFKCLAKKSESIAPTSKFHFKEVERYLRQILINSAADAKARSEICFSSNTIATAKGEVQKAINRIKGEVSNSCRKGSTSDLVKSLSEDLSNRLKNELDWMGCEEKAKTDVSGCNFRSIKFDPDTKHDINADYASAKGSDHALRSIKECEVRYANTLASEMQCHPDFSIHFGTADNLIHSVEKNVREAFFDDLRKTYILNIATASTVFLGGPPQIPSNCATYESSIGKIPQSTNSEFATKFKGQPKSVAENVRDAALALQTLGKKLRKQIAEIKSLNSRAMSRSGDSALVQPQVERKQESVEQIESMIKNILDAYPFLIGKEAPSILSGGIYGNPGELIPVKQMLHSSDPEKALSKILSDFKVALSNELLKACETQPEKITWRDLVANNALVKSALNAESKGAALREDLGKFRSCIKEKMDRYNTGSGVVITTSMALPVLGPVFGGVTSTALSLFAASSAFSLALHNYGEASQNYENALQCNKTSGGVNCTKKEIVEAERDKADAAFEVAITAGVTAFEAGKLGKGLVEHFNSTRGSLPSKIPLQFVKADPTWELFGKRFKYSTGSVIEHNRAGFIAAKARQDHFATFLEKIGFKFEPVVEAPDGFEAVKKVESMIDELVAAGKVEQSEVLYPARAFKTKEGKTIFVRTSQVPPEGAKPIAELLSGDDYISAIRQGLFPIGEAIEGALNASIHVPALHDLAHLEAFIRNPKFMAAVRKGIEKVPRDRSLYGLLDFNTKSYNAGGYREGILWATEFTTYVPKSKKADLLKALSLPARPKPITGGYRVSEVYEHLKTMKPEELETTIDRVKKAYLDTVEFAGGGENDLVARLNYKEQSAPFKDMPINSVFDQLQHPKAYGIHSLEEKRVLLARLETALVDISEISPETWAQDLLKGHEHIERTSKLYHFFCESEFLNFGINKMPEFGHPDFNRYMLWEKLCRAH